MNVSCEACGRGVEKEVSEVNQTRKRGYGLHCSRSCANASRARRCKEPARIAGRLAAQSEPEPNTGCVLFTGMRNRQGYGLINVGRQFLAHRVAYELAKGPIPNGLQLDHLCRVRCCINPDHLEPVNQRENKLRGMSPSALNARKTRCIRGHEFTPENTYRWRGARHCIRCQKQRAT